MQSENESLVFQNQNMNCMRNVLVTVVAENYYSAARSPIDTSESSCKSVPAATYMAIVRVHFSDSHRLHTPTARSVSAILVQFQAVRAPWILKRRS